LILKKGKMKKSSPEIFLLSTCHGEYAWMHTRLWHKLRYILVFQEVLELLEKTEFKWYLENYRTQLHVFLNEYPGAKKKLRRFVRSGKLAICGDFTSIRPNMVGEETIVRNFILGKEILERYFPGVKIEVNADYGDVSMWNSQMPQLLTLSGYKYILGGRPGDALDIKGIPEEFLWVGLDGSQVICCRKALTAINHPSDIQDYKNDWKNSRKKILTPLKKRVRKTPFVPAYFISHGGDDTRPLKWGGDDSPVDIAGFLKEWNSREEIPLKFGTPDEYFEKIERVRSKLLQVREVIDPCDVCFNASFGGSKGLWSLRRQIDEAICKAEFFSCLAADFGLSYPEKEIEKLWKELLTICSHATQWLFQKDFGRIYQAAITTKFKADNIRKKALETIANNIKLSNNDRVLVFNPLPWPSEKIVKIQLCFPEGAPESWQLFDANGRKLCFQVTNKMSGWGFRNLEYELFTKLQLPGLGYNTITVKESRQKAVTCSSRKQALENRYFKIEFQDGSWKSILHKQTGHLLRYVTFKFYKVNPDFYLHVGKILKVEEINWKKGEMEETGPLVYSCKSTGLIGRNSIVLQTTIYREEPVIEFQTEILWSGGNGFLTLEMEVPVKGKMLADIPFGLEKRELQKEPYDETETTYMIDRKRKGMFFSRSFVLFQKGEYSFAFVSHNGDRYYIYDEKKGILKHILINSIAYEKNWEKDVNQERKCQGVHRFKNSCLFLKHASLVEVYKKVGIIKMEPEIYYPLRENWKGKLQSNTSFMVLKPDNLMISAFYIKNGCYYLRIYEAVGKRTRGFLRLPFIPEKVEPVNFLGEILPAFTIASDRENIYFELDPFKILTLRIER